MKKIQTHTLTSHKHFQLVGLPYTVAVVAKEGIQPFLMCINAEGIS